MTHNELARQRLQLARLVRANYMSGRQEAVMLLLNQQDPAAVGRMFSYYRYLAQARSKARIPSILVSKVPTGSLPTVATPASEAR